MDSLVEPFSVLAGDDGLNVDTGASAVKVCDSNMLATDSDRLIRAIFQDALHVLSPSYYWHDEMASWGLRHSKGH